MKPEEDKYWGLTDLVICNVVILVVNAFLCVKDLLSFSRSSKVMSMVIPGIYCLHKVDWTSLLEPRLSYQEEEKVDPHRVEMATALAICVGPDPGRIVGTLGGEYTGASRDVDKIVGDVE